MSAVIEFETNVKGETGYNLSFRRNWPRWFFSLDTSYLRRYKLDRNVYKLDKNVIGSLSNWFVVICASSELTLRFVENHSIKNNEWNLSKFQSNIISFKNIKTNIHTLQYWIFNLLLTILSHLYHRQCWNTIKRPMITLRHCFILIF